MECINIHTKINRIIIHYYTCLHYYTYLVIQSKVKLTHTETQRCSDNQTRRSICPYTSYRFYVFGIMLSVFALILVAANAHRFNCWVLLLTSAHANIFVAQFSQELRKRIWFTIRMTSSVRHEKYISWLGLRTRPNKSQPTRWVQWFASVSPNRVNMVLNVHRKHKAY